MVNSNLPIIKIRSLAPTFSLSLCLLYNHYSLMSVDCCIYNSFKFDLMCYILPLENATTMLKGVIK